MILLYTILVTSTLFHIGSRATITSGIWRRYPYAVARFMDCAMCAGAWYGLLTSIVFQVLGYRYPGLDSHHAPFVCFLASAAWTPVGAGLVQLAMDQIGTKQPIIDEMIKRQEIVVPDEESRT